MIVLPLFFLREGGHYLGGRWPMYLKKKTDKDNKLFVTFLNLEKACIVGGGIGTMWILNR